MGLLDKYNKLSRNVFNSGVIRNPVTLQKPLTSIPPQTNTFNKKR